MKISEIESALTRSGYDTCRRCDKGSFIVEVRLEKPHRWVGVVKMLSADTFEMYQDKNYHPKALTTLHLVSKLLGVEGEIEEDGSPF